MKRSDKIKLNFTRNWRLPGRKRLSSWFKASEDLKASISDGIVWLADENIAIYTSADNYIEWTILSTGTYEDETNKLIKISLNPGGVAMDVGGNIGLQSIRMSKSVGEQGKVFVFEPLIHLQEKLSRNIQLNKADNVKLFPYALSNHESEADFHISKGNWNQGTFNISNNQSGTEVQHVIIKVADELPEIKALNRLDLVKIDVEGFEYQVLLGLKQTIGKYKPRIIFEYDKNYWEANAQNFNECFDFLSSLGYTLYQITPVGCELVKHASAAVAGNLFCIPS
ncbi:MAG: FkbM family methyltransferase [Bacteroidetes bacterium]|jgi:FkbM family methyltransferase|nr:FkbM family methyltransferase [Bacteroidota bacterium]